MGCLKCEKQTLVSPRVVEESAIPEAVYSTGPTVEETGVRAVKAVQPVLCVLGSVAVHHIKQDDDTQRVSHVNQLLEFLWGAKTTGERERRTDEGRYQSSLGRGCLSSCMILFLG